MRTHAQPSSNGSMRHLDRRSQSGGLQRQALGRGPATAPPIVSEVLRSSGTPLPAGTRRAMEERLGHSFADVRIHNDARAGQSALDVDSLAYTVGRHIAFAPGRFAPESTDGERLLVHELAHAASHPSWAPTPLGDLHVSTPDEPGERSAAHAANRPSGSPVRGAPSPTLYRQGGATVALTGATVNHSRVTVPPIAGLTFRATKAPANAPTVTFSLVGDNATINPASTINASTGAITVSPAQTGGSAHVLATQVITAPDGSTTTTTATAPFNFVAIPTAITGTTASLRNLAGFYGGDFFHTFGSPAGGATALERSHVNERFPTASGTTLTVNGTLGPLTVTVNDPNDPAAGWDLDSSGTMAGPDQVTWSDGVDARPFVRNASHPNPANPLPQALAAAQQFRNLSFPGQTYGAAAVASTTHRRAIEDRANRLKAVTSAGINREVEEDYAGPTVFRRCRATPASIAVAAPAPPGGAAPAPATSQITVDAEGVAAAPTFSLQGPTLGCTITPAGLLTPGTTTGTVTVRAGDATNFDETVVTLTPRPAPPPAPAPAPTP